jgi:nucleotide-binding universal stress UspA family protein
MQTIKRVLFPVDLTEPSEKIIPYVLKVVEVFEAELHVLFVLSVLDQLEGLHVPYLDFIELSRTAQEGAQDKLQKLCTKHFSGVSSCGAFTRIGDAPREIIQYVRENSIDLIVMATHGRMGVSKLFFGSVVDKVVRQSPVPVMTVRPS